METDRWTDRELRDRIFGFVTRWGLDRMQELGQPLRSKFPFIVEFAVRRRQEDASDEEFSLLLQELRTTTCFRETLWFYSLTGPSELLRYVENNCGPWLLSSARFTEDAKAERAREERKQPPLRWQDQAIVMHILKWCHERDFNPFDEKLPHCFQLDLKRCLEEEAAEGGRRKVELIRFARRVTALSYGEDSEEIRALEAQLDLKEERGTSEWKLELSRLALSIVPEIDQIDRKGRFCSRLFCPSATLWTELFESITREFAPFDEFSSYGVPR